MYCVMSPFVTCDQNSQSYFTTEKKPELLNQVGTTAKSRIVMSPLAA